MSMLGGAWFPASMMPAWVQKLSFAVPSRWALDGMDAMLWARPGLRGGARAGGGPAGVHRRVHGGGGVAVPDDARDGVSACGNDALVAEEAL